MIHLAKHITSIQYVRASFFKVRPLLAPVSINQFWNKRRFFIFSRCWSKRIKQWEMRAEAMLYGSTDMEQTFEQWPTERVWQFRGLWEKSRQEDLYFHVDCQLNNHTFLPLSVLVFMAQTEGRPVETDWRSVGGNFALALSANQHFKLSWTNTTVAFQVTMRLNISTCFH